MQTDMYHLEAWKLCSLISLPLALSAVGSNLSLPGRAELEKLPSSRCPGALNHDPGGCKGPECVHMTRCQGRIHTPITTVIYQ